MTSSSIGTGLANIISRPSVITMKITIDGDLDRVTETVVKKLINRHKDRIMFHSMALKASS